MQLPLTDPETLFEGLLQDLPPETAQMAGSSKPLCGPRRSKRPSNSCGSSLLLWLGQILA